MDEVVVGGPIEQPEDPDDHPTAYSTKMFNPSAFDSESRCCVCVPMASGLICLFVGMLLLDILNILCFMVSALPLSKNDITPSQEVNLWDDIAKLSSYDLGGTYALLVGIDVLINCINFYILYIIVSYLQAQAR